MPADRPIVHQASHRVLRLLTGGLTCHKIRILHPTTARLSRSQRLKGRGDDLRRVAVRWQGGTEPPSVFGHLDDGEPIVKPTLVGRFLCFSRP